MSPDQYGKGYDDYYFVTFWTVAFTFLRAAIMKYFFHPIAKMAGIQSFGKRQRFAEQGWMFSYYSVFWVFGMVRDNIIVYFILLF
jgi:acyl-CoA-dependent ceramide synthase